MKRALKYAATGFLILALSPLVAFFAYDLTVFQPRRAEISALLAQADPQDRDPPPLIRRYIAVANEPVSRMVTRYLLKHFGYERSRGFDRVWREALWEKLIGLHLPEPEILGLFTSLSYSGYGHYGLNAAAWHLFGKKLDALSEPEAATVVALLKAPSYYASNRRKLEERRDVLLAKAQRN